VDTLTLTAAKMPLAPEMTAPEIDLKDPALYFNRELSWIEFNRRVLEEAQDSRHPLLERVKFWPSSARTSTSFS